MLCGLDIDDGLRERHSIRLHRRQPASPKELLASARQKPESLSYGMAVTARRDISPAARIDDKPAAGMMHRAPVQIRERFMVGLGVRRAI
jgi:hypothetical protein